MFISRGYLNPPAGPGVFSFGRLSRQAAGGGGSWSVDATSGIGVPADATEWANLIAAEALTNWSAPTSLYLCQEAVAPIVDVIGAFDLTTTGSTHAYQQSVSGWSRFALELSDGATARGWRTLDASLPDINTTSCLLLAYVVQPASVPAAERVEVQLGTTSTSVAILKTDGTLRGASGGNSVSGTTSVLSTVTPVVVRANRTAGTIHVFTATDEMGPTTLVTTGKAMYLGSAFSAPDIGYLYAARWDGASAEVSDQDVKDLLRALGWTVTGY